ncbi:protein TAPT1 homolog [Daphnia pulex]|uniref:protein TAPT1 homolog n=1 Tax=Daphnia pulex TaxID=6669 RepID=UPI001EE0B6DD|nr:protein TAPT1 homolog [Daphnia pulex]
MPSFYSFVRAELYRGYQLENDEERYVARRQKVYLFMKIPREVEKFMSYGFFQCTDAFLFLFTFLPLRFVLAIWGMVTRPILHFFCFSKIKYKRILQPSEIVDVLKGTIIIICCIILSHVDMAMMYHLIKSQSVIKLYIFYNMLETGDRLFSVFGQDIIDALFWTATERKGRKREHLGVIPHFIMAVIYVLLHTVLVLLQATTLNVAINSSNKALLTIMMSNNFVELKSSVFKKFDKNNLFQLSCSDVRERFHLSILLLVVVIQTMREYMWKEERFWVLIPDCLMVILAEVIVDWVKHAFITRFNDIPSNIYQEFTLSLAYDLAATKQKHAFTDHSDLVARRMGFIPLPLGVLAIRIVSQAIQIDNFGDAFVLFFAFLCLGSFRILSNIVTLGKACDLIDTHQKQRTTAAIATTATGLAATAMSSTTESASPRASRSERRAVATEDRECPPKNDVFPEPPGLFVRSMSIDDSQLSKLSSVPDPTDVDILTVPLKVRSASHSPPRRSDIGLHRRGSGRRMRISTPPQIPPLIPELGQPIFSNSTVSLTSICLNEEIFDEDDTLIEGNFK